MGILFYMYMYILGIPRHTNVQCVCMAQFYLQLDIVEASLSTECVLIISEKGVCKINELCQG